MPALPNARHERFAQEIANGSSVSEAYATAGYEPNPGNARRLRVNEAVTNRIEAILREREHIHSRAIEKAVKDTGISIGRVLTELAKIGFADIRKAVKWGDGIAVKDDRGEFVVANGVSLIGSDEIDDQTAAAIAEVSQTKDGLKVKFHDKRGALVDIGRHLGMFKEEKGGDQTFIQIVQQALKLEVTAPPELGEIMTPEKWRLEHESGKTEDDND